MAAVVRSIPNEENQLLHMPKEFGIPYIQRLIKTNFGFNKGKNGFVCYDCKLLGGISIPYDQQPKLKPGF